MLHFVTSFMIQNKSRKQTLESAQYGLEISFKFVIIYTQRSMSRHACGIACSMIENFHGVTA